MAIRIYNTLFNKKQEFKPLREGKVGMYVCGPTVYDSCHIGHARSVVVFDVIFRYFKSRGFDVTYVRNFTDVDDKIINRANEFNILPGELTEKYINEFYHDMDALNVERATHEPKATEHIDSIIEVIETLIEKQMAYEVGGDVYYAVERHEGYGKLSGRRLEDMEAGARVKVDKRKKNPFDFALWKSAKPGELSWESRWGRGRPGWHIECSAMSGQYLGQPFDIHGGGKDLIFPHHENEIAQSEAAFEKPFAQYWMHNGFVNIDHQKMSKSLGNFTMIKDVLESYHPEAVRLFLLSNHYRSPIDFTDQSMDEATMGLDKIYTVMDRTEALQTAPDDRKTERGEYWHRFCEAMDDDFNTARGIGILYDAVRHLNRLIDENTGEGDSLPGTIRRDLMAMGQSLGIMSETPKRYFDKARSSALKTESIDDEEIERMIQARNQARKEKDYAAADHIRSKLDALNITLEDRPDGTVWKVGKP